MKYFRITTEAKITTSYIVATEEEDVNDSGFEYLLTREILSEDNQKVGQEKIVRVDELTQEEKEEIAPDIIEEIDRYDDYKNPVS